MGLGRGAEGGEVGRGAGRYPAVLEASTALVSTEGTYRQVKEQNFRKK